MKRLLGLGLAAALLLSMGCAAQNSAAPSSSAALSVSDGALPDSLLRVHMVYKGLPQPVKVQAQTLTPWRRTGFAAVEWGGSRA